MATKKNAPAEIESTVTETLVEKLARIERENEELKGDSENYAIPLDSYIEVMSLFPGKLNLSTEPLGKGRKFSFSKFGETKRILYNDLASILEGYRSFMEQGLFYIVSDKVIRKHGLHDVYSRILSKSMIEKIIDCDPKHAVKLYESATPEQRDIIDGMLVKELKTGTPDLNIISQISKIAQKDLAKIAEDALALESLPSQ